MIGLLRDKAEIRIPESEPDGQGGWRETGHRSVQVWLGMEPTGTATDPDTGRERNRYRATLRHRTDISAPARLHWRGRVLNILSADDPDLRGERLHLICEDL